MRFQSSMPQDVIAKAISILMAEKKGIVGRQTAYPDRKECACGDRHCERNFPSDSDFAWAWGVMDLVTAQLS